MSPEIFAALLVHLKPPLRRNLFFYKVAFSYLTVGLAVIGTIASWSQTITLQLHDNTLRHFRLVKRQPAELDTVSCLCLFGISALCSSILANSAQIACKDPKYT